MIGHLKLSHHQHSGRLRPHEHTSYVPLVLLTLIVGALLALFSYSTIVNAATPYDGPEAGSIGLTGRMPAAPPKVGATIDSPTNQQHFTTSPIKISGTCPTGTLVEIYKNNIFAGSTPCESNGKYSIEIDLLFGQNTLKAQVYDVLNQAGPESNTVIVFYDTALPQAAPSSFLNLTGSQLILNTDSAFRGSFPKQKFNVPITVVGGTPPFAINVQWGDSNNQIVPRSDNSTFNTTHAYQRPGTYKITLQGTDSKQLTAFLTVAAIVNGQPDVIAAATGKLPLNKLFVLWPLYAITLTFVVSFWLGERREKRILGKLANVPNSSFGVMPPKTTA